MCQQPIPLLSLTHCRVGPEAGPPVSHLSHTLAPQPMCQKSPRSPISRQHTMLPTSACSTPSRLGFPRQGAPRLVHLSTLLCHSSPSPRLPPLHVGWDKAVAPLPTPVTRWLLPPPRLSCHVTCHTPCNAPANHRCRHPIPRPPPSIGRTSGKMSSTRHVRVFKVIPSSFFNFLVHHTSG
jgi:hypothetical protein